MEQNIYLINNYSLFSLTENKSYIGTITPTITNPNTLKPTTEPFYLVRCDDGILRKIESKYFITLEEWRERQLNKLLHKK